MNKLILVVDDNHTNLKLAQQILGKTYDVATVNSGERVFTCLERIKPDLILLDVNMPGLSGFEVMERLLQNDKWATIPVIFLTADNNSVTEVKCFELGAVDFIRKPFEAKIMIKRIRKTLELEDYKKGLEKALKQQADRINSQNERILNMQQEVMNIQQEVIESMANLIENRDGSTGLHVKRTSGYVEMIADEMMKRNIYSDTLTSNYKANLVKAAPMHDIGKIYISDQILCKPGKLTAEEFEIMKTHSVKGGNVIKSAMGKIEKKEYIDMATDVATYHHERWDGNGYPEGLKGLEIPLGARIMAVADVFDALISKRCYKEALPFNEAFKIVEESRGSHFDPVIAEVFLSLRSKIEEFAETERDVE